MIDPSHYHRIGYDNKFRFISYWNQINAVMTLNLQPVLEIGIGNGLVSNYLKQRGINITTMDIDGRLRPDTVGSVTSIPFSEGIFKIVVCYEVLEHLQYVDFSKALSEIYRVTDEYAILSLPDATQAYRFEFWIPILGVFTGLLKLPWVHPKHEFDADHRWEIGMHGYPLRRIIGDIEKVGFEVVKTYRAFEHPGHRFFKLKKIIK